MKEKYSTHRLYLQNLSTADAGFIHELVNSSNWKKFIGERNIHNEDDAVKYIQTILLSKQINYRVVFLKEQKVPVGIITLIKRAYLEHADFGFAFLPQFTKKGFAREASEAVLQDIFQSEKHRIILAVTVKENTDSIQLLNKLGFLFNRELVNDNAMLQVFQGNIDSFKKQAQS